MDKMLLKHHQFQVNGIFKFKKSATKDIYCLTTSVSAGHLWLSFCQPISSLCVSGSIGPELRLPYGLWRTQT